MRKCAVLLALASLGTSPTSGAAQARDTTRARDTLHLLPELEVRVTRGAERSARLPMSVGVLRGATVRTAQLTTGIDESLSRLPGVVVLNRYNYSLDQRISLRGAGSRANFGLRGVKVLLDGVPQTLPDGQSQLSNLELGLVERIEVLTGAAGALYGNASGGVLAFTTRRPLAPLAGSARIVGGSFGTTKWQSVVEGRSGSVSALASLSRLTTDGFRQHGRAEALQATGTLDILLGARSSLALRASLADAPHAENPGALTAAEYAVRRDSAAGTSILRGADKDVRQQQVSLRYRWVNGAGLEADATVFGLHRGLDNPLATPPPAPAPATAGTYNTIGRNAYGARAAVTLPVGGASGAVRMTLGVDAQRMRDDRRNERSDAGRPTGTVLADQRETVSELGPFAQLHWAPGERVLLLGALRYDRLAFVVRDHFLTDGIDNSGDRVMQNASGSLGASVQVGEEVSLFTSAATSFESPTTTELVNQSNGTVGFNTALGPQRSRSAELGVRARRASGLEFSATVFVSRIKDAIIQAREQDGRAFFVNAGTVRNKGLEAGFGVEPWSWLRIRTAYTWADYRFGTYRIPNGAATDTLDGNRLAGVPRHFFRGTATVTRGVLMVELDQVTAGEMFADDRNIVAIDGWGLGVTSIRTSVTIRRQGMRFEPFVALNNAFDRRYVGSANINGAFGRVLEPAPGRNGYVGLEVSWAKP